MKGRITLQQKKAKKKQKSEQESVLHFTQMNLEY